MLVFFSVAKELKELHLHLLTAIDEKDIQSVSSIYNSHLQYLYNTISTNILNQTEENKPNPTRCLKRDSHTLKHLKAGARLKLRCVSTKGNGRKGACEGYPEDVYPQFLNASYEPVMVIFTCGYFMGVETRTWGISSIPTFCIKFSLHIFILICKIMDHRKPFSIWSIFQNR